MVPKTKTTQVMETVYDYEKENKICEKYYVLYSLIMVNGHARWVGS